MKPGMYNNSYISIKFQIMKFIRVLLAVSTIFPFILSGCAPQEVDKGTQLLSSSSKLWVPYVGDEIISFADTDSNRLVFQGMGYTDYLERVLYQSDQSGLFKSQQDYYANMERMNLTFASDSTNYVLNFNLEANKSEVGDFDVLRVTVSDGAFYYNTLKIVVYKTSEFNYGEVFKKRPTLTLKGRTYANVYYWQQERRPFEVYFTKTEGIIAMTLFSDQLWVREWNLP